jgi:hypothetical protein
MRHILCAAGLLLAGSLTATAAQTREVLKISTRCYVRQPDQQFTAYPCELRLVYSNPDPVPDAVQVKWAYGGLTEFLYSRSRGWQWLEPTSRTWVPAEAEWVETPALSCYRFGNMCFGRGFPVLDSPPSSPVPPATASGLIGSSTGSVTAAEAIACVEALYRALSRQDFTTAGRYFSGRAALQFDPAFFRQFRRVTVSDLRVTGQGGESVSLLGSNRYEYRDGATQTEERSYRVERVNGTPRIVASEFRAVLRSR